MVRVASGGRSDQVDVPRTLLDHTQRIRALEAATPPAGLSWAVISHGGEDIASAATEFYYDFAGDVLETGNGTTTYELIASTGADGTGKTGITIHQPGIYWIELEGAMYEKIGGGVTAPETIYTQTTYVTEASVTYLDGTTAGGGYGHPSPLPWDVGVPNHAWSHHFAFMIGVTTDMGTLPILAIGEQQSGQTLSGFVDIHMLKVA